MRQLVDCDEFRARSTKLCDDGRQGGGCRPRPTVHQHDCAVAVYSHAIDDPPDLAARPARRPIPAVNLPAHVAVAKPGQCSEGPCARVDGTKRTAEPWSRID